MITYLDLADYLPDGTFTFPATDQLLFNFGLLNPGDSTDSMVEALAKFLDALSKLTEEVNKTRAEQTPKLSPIDLCTKSYVGTPEEPKLQFSLVFPVDVKSFVENVIDPAGE